MAYHKHHKLTIEWSGEYGEESSSTGTCTCGWTESASNQVEVRHEYACHMKDVKSMEESAALYWMPYWHGTLEMACRRIMSEDQVTNLIAKGIRGCKLPAWTERAIGFRESVEKVRAGVLDRFKDW